MAPPKIQAPRRPPSGVHQIVRGTGQCLFAIVIILVFAAAVLVGAGAIKLPQWAKSLDQYTDEERTGPAIGLLGCVCLLFILLFGVGLLQMRREERGNWIR